MRTPWTLACILILAGCSRGAPDATISDDVGAPDIPVTEVACTPKTDPTCRPSVDLDQQPCTFAGHAPGDVPSLQPTEVPQIGTHLGAAAWTGTGWLSANGDGQIIDEGGTVLVDRPDAEILALAVNRDGAIAFSSRVGDGLRVELRRADGTIDELFHVPMSEPERAGGGLALQDDGILWIGVGDGGYGWNAIDETALSGSILRVDVTTRPYTVPTDNPNAAHPTRRPEIWAIGVRDPHACAVSAGELLCSDRAEEYVELNRIARHADYGWPYRDGPVCVEGTCSQRQNGPLAFRPTHDECGLLPGPHLSTAIPDGAGVRVFGGICTGRLWGVRATDAGVRETRRMGGGAPNLVGFGSVDPTLRTITGDGTGQDWSFVDDGARFPRTLAESGCLDASQDFASTLIPYDVASALWTDGAHKERVIALPAGAHATVDSEGRLLFPDGTAILKLFSAELDDGSLQKLETRVMRRTDGVWDFYTFVWEDNETARLLDGDLDVEVRGSAGYGDYTHYVPSRTGCHSCHLEDLPVLGPTAAQLDRDVEFAGGHANQMAAFSALGVVQGAATVPALADFRDPAAPLQERARSYLHANCAHCHRPDGWAPRSLGIDLRYSTALSATGTCGVEAGFGKTWAEGDYRIDAGHPENSNLLQRMLADNAGRMPPIGTALVDVEGAAVVEAWIASLADCD